MCFNCIKYEYPNAIYTKHEEETPVWEMLPNVEEWMEKTYPGQLGDFVDMRLIGTFFPNKGE